MSHQPIGVFDSGIGGLTILKALRRELPCEDFVYFGDTARVPYGSKSKATVVKFSIENVEWLLQFRVKLIVIACHTSSAWALATLKSYFKVPIVGVIQPGAEAACEASRTKRIGVIGTASTIQSGAYEEAMQRVNGRVQLVAQSCPLLVSFVEEGWVRDPVCEAVVHRYLAPVLRQRVDTLLLGCTHYPLLTPVIRRVVGSRVAVVDAGQRTALNVRSLLEHAGQLARARRGSAQFSTSDEPQRFARLGAAFLGQPIRHVRLATS